MRIKAFLIAGFMSLFASCAFAQTEVIWWDFLSGGDGVRMKALIERFNKEHSDIKINATTLEWGVPYYTKVKTSVAVGQVPDVMTYHLSRFTLGIQEGVLDEITDDDLNAANIQKERFFATSIAAATGDDGKLYGVPFDIHALVMFYNKNWLEGSRFLDGEGKITGINSLADFEEALVFAKEKGAEIPLSYGTSDDGATYRLFYTLLRQLDGELISNGEALAGDNLDKVTQVLEIMRHWAEEGWQPEQTEYAASIALFATGKSAFLLNGVWEVPTFADMQANGTLGFEWSATQMPTILGNQTGWADSHAFAIPANTSMSPEKRRAVMEVIGWMAKNSLAWAGAGHIPAFKDVVESEAFRQMEPNANYANLADTASFDPRSNIAGVASPIYDLVDSFISPAIHGFLTPREAAEQIKQDLQNNLK